jgi:hypothetical protein
VLLVPVALVKEVFVRRIPALLGAAALLAATLVGCSAVPGGGCTPTYSSGDASSIVTAKGKVGAEPTIDFPTPLVATKPQVSQVVAGHGDSIPAGAQVGFYSTVSYAKDGKNFGSSGYEKSGVQLLAAGQKNSSISKALACAQVGERLVLVTTMKDTGDVFGTDAAQAVDPKEVLVDIIDVVLTYPGKSEGMNQLPRDGMPTVVTAVDGTPGIQVPKQNPPKNTEISTIKAGSGTVIKKGDNVVVTFSLWTWPETDGDDPASVISTWDSKKVTTFPATGTADGGSLPQGLVDAMIGQKIGSQVLAVIPPGSDGFTADQLANDSIPGVSTTSTVIFVIDLLGLQK